MTEQVELRPCPFCGTPAYTDGGLAWCPSPECYMEDANMPINIWNTRPLEDALRRQLEDCTDIIQGLLTCLPDSPHENDESWEWCWNELRDDAQDIVKRVRSEAQKVLAEIGGE
jgi:hypothetical protein